MVSNHNQPKSGPTAYFTLLPKRKSRPGTYVAAVAVEIGFALLMLAISTIWPHTMRSVKRRIFTPVYLAAAEKQPPITHLRMRRPRVRRETDKVQTLPIPRARIERKRVRMAEAPTVASKFQAPTAFYHSREPSKPRPVIHTGVLASTVAKLDPPRKQDKALKVQTGGFGDPNGAQTLANAHRSVAVSSVGSFGSPVGPGKGNGHRGRHGSLRLVANAGFGNGVSSSNQAGNTHPNRGVHAGVFSNKAIDPAPHAAVQVAKPSIQPLKILDKPEPVYTAAARKHKIQGNVVLDVIFASNGQIKVLRVVSGLGYGLDQAAISAARRIRFRPERKDGKPVSVNARLRIVFRLAY